MIEVDCDQSFSLQRQWSISSCSLSNCLDVVALDPTLIITTTNELFIPSRTLPCGIYQLKLTVTMNISTSESVFVRIIPSGLAVHLLPLGTSLISSGVEQDLQLNPGLYSLDFDEDQFNASDWNYHYYCRIDSVFNVPQLPGGFIPLKDPLIPSCFNNRSGTTTIFFFTCQMNVSSAWRYTGVPQSLKSSLSILGGSLLANRTYQFMVQIEHRRNNSLQSEGYLLVRVEQISATLITIG